MKAPNTLPAGVAKGFVKDMRAFFAEEDATKRDAIAVRQLRTLAEHQGPREILVAGGFEKHAGCKMKVLAALACSCFLATAAFAQINNPGTVVIDNTKYLYGYLAIALAVLILFVFIARDRVIALLGGERKRPVLKVFLSYRRDDSGGESGRIHDRLRGDLGEGSTFFDVSGIPPGVNFLGKLAEEVARCNVLLAIIGPKWLDMPDEKGGRRLDDLSDLVRVEIRTALQRDIPVIPISLNGTRFPRESDLPTDIRGLANRQGLEVRHTAFHDDVDRLVTALKKIDQR